MGTRPGGTPECPALFFDTPADFDAWLAEHHATERELWMGLNKSHVHDRGLTWADAVPVALAWGWIDSTSQSIDADARRQRWSPRKRGSTWSLVNIAHVERLTAAGLMQPAGLAAFERRTEARSGIYTYEAPPAELSRDHEALLRADAVAAAFWDAATPTYRKLCRSWVAGAKQQETRDSRAAQLVASCAAGELIPPQRYGQTPAWVAKARALRG